MVKVVDFQGAEAEEEAEVRVAEKLLKQIWYYSPMEWNNMQPTDQARILQYHVTQSQTWLTSNKCNFEATIAAVTSNSQDTSNAQVSSIRTDRRCI